MDELDDLFDSIINKPKKPQPKKAEASSLDEGKKYDPLKSRRVKVVPYLRKWPTCVTCEGRLLGDRFGWFLEDKDGRHWWWCVKCLERTNRIATDKEKEHARKEHQAYILRVRKRRAK
tara:strand:- start:619 stop:972 length:354 start_codon:yes stop_codon:yes gene_type:complete